MRGLGGLYSVAPKGFIELNALLSRGLTHPAYAVSPQGALLNWMISCHGGLRTPPMLCRPKGLCHDSTKFTGIDTSVYAVSSQGALLN